MTTALIRLQSISRHYQSGNDTVSALRNVTLDIGAGEFVAIIGTSGSGKSTLMNTLGCLDRPSEGEYWLDGRETSRLDQNELAGLRNTTLGFVFQSFNLLSRTSALENVELPLLYSGIPPEQRQRRATEMLERVGLGQRLHHFPSQLSGGQQQRVAIARALVGKPKLLLADEPTGNLDSSTGDEVMALFHEIGRAGITILLVTHDPDVAAQAGRVITMKDGCVIRDHRQSPRFAEAGAA